MGILWRLVGYERSVRVTDWSELRDGVFGVGGVVG